MAGPLKLDTKIVDKPWGRRGIDPRFGVDGDARSAKSGSSRRPRATLDVMAKYLFTTERLSIQVHPDDATAQARGYPRGKDECWIILDVADDAELGIGTVREASGDEVIAAARDGSIVDLLDWRRPARRRLHLQSGGDDPRARAGADRARDPAGGRPHLSPVRLWPAARASPRRSARRGPGAAASRTGSTPGSATTSMLLVAGPHFGVAWCVGEPPVLPQGMRDVQLLPIDAAVGGVGPGECALIDEHAGAAPAQRGQVRPRLVARPLTQSLFRRRLPPQSRARSRSPRWCAARSICASTLATGRAAMPNGCALLHALEVARRGGRARRAPARRQRQRDRPGQGHGAGDALAPDDRSALRRALRRALIGCGSGVSSGTRTWPGSPSSRFAAGAACDERRLPARERRGASRAQVRAADPARPQLCHADRPRA